MIVDLEKADTGDIHCDICIVGAGMAGLVLAHALSDGRARIGLLESGGNAYEPGTQALYRGRLAGVPNFPLDTCRIRQLGGTSAHWGGACWPLEPVDFEKKDWVAHSGWPIAYADLEPYFRKAHDLCQLQDYNYAHDDDQAYRRDARAQRPFDLAYRYVAPRFYKTSRVMRFSRYFEEELKKRAHLTLYLHANVTELRRREASGAIASALVSTLSGKRRQVHAKQFVLATGGIENPRLLLASHRQQAAGIGNQHDLVGRFFMDHPFLTATASLLLVPGQDLGYFKSHVLSDGVQVRGGLGLKRQAIVEQKLMNAWFGMEVMGTPPVPKVEGMPPRETDAAAHETAVATAGELHVYLADKRGRAADNGAGAQPFVVNTTIVGEQAPNPNSRVTLSGERDALGVPLPVLDWRLTPDDYRNIVEAHRLLGRELGASGAGRLLLNLPPAPDAWSSAEKIAQGGGVYGSYHHMGTTRMAQDERHGVVDTDCRVFGTPNLYVAGSSVFPTVGYANPTLTLLALAYRLADHLNKPALRPEV